MLAKVSAVGTERPEVKRTCDIFRGQIVDVTGDSYTIQLVGTTEKLDAFLRGAGGGHDSGSGPLRRSGIGRGDKILSL